MTARRPSAWILAGIALCVWILAANVYGQFRSVRVKVPSDTQGSQRTALPLSAANRIPDPYVVVIYRLRNIGSEPVTVTARVDDRMLEQSALGPGESIRVDVALPYSPSNGSRQFELEGTNGDWRLEYVEFANLHGFTRGIVEFLILPAGQPFGMPPAWLYATFVLWAVLIVVATPVSSPRWLRLFHHTLSGLFLMLLVAAAVSPFVSAFRIALATHTFASGLLLLAAPQLLAGLWRGSLYLVPPTRDAFRRLRAAAGIETRRDVANRLREIARAMRPAPAVVRAIQGLPWSRIVGAAALAGYAFLVWTNVGAYAGGADQSGYLNGARLLSGGQLTAPVRTIPNVPVGSIRLDAYAPLGFRPIDSDTIAPTYPIGLPLVIAAGALFGDLNQAAHHATAFFALAGVVLIVWLAKECGLSNWGALFAALILATSPLYLFMSMQLMSDTPALVWVSAAVLVAWRSRRVPALAFVAGATFAIAVLTRPTNLLALVPMAICLGLSPRRWLWLVAGGLPGAVVLMRFNVMAYGSAITTGYGDMGALFAISNVEASVRNYVTYLPVHLTVIGVLALGLPFLLRRGNLLIAVLLAWAATFTVFFAFYFHTHETWWYLRFLLPAFPPFIVGSLLVGKSLLERTRAIPRMRHAWFGLPVAAALVLTALVLENNVRWGRFWLVLDSGRGERTYVEAAEWALRNLPPHAAILAMQVSGCFFYYTDFPVLRWDYLDKEAVGLLEAEAEAGRQPLYAVLFPFEVDERQAFRDPLRGRWTMIGGVKQITFWEFTGTADSPVEAQ